MAANRRRRPGGAGRHSAWRRLATSALLAVFLVFLAWALIRGGHAQGPHLSVQPPPAHAAPPPVSSPPHADHAELALVHSSRLSAPLQDAAATQFGKASALLVGGLTAADTSSDAISVVGGGGGHLLGRLPAALHDATAVELGRSAYLFGGGDGTGQLDRILRIDASGRVTIAGRLPAPSSDQVAAAVDGTAYVVGGFTGTHWLDTIVAWRPGGSARVVGRLPTPVRYAAVTAAAGKLLIAGGSLPSGTAGRAVLVFDPADPPGAPDRNAARADHTRRRRRARADRIRDRRPRFRSGHSNRPNRRGRPGARRRSSGRSSAGAAE